MAGRPIVEWHFGEDEADWARVETQSGAPAAMPVQAGRRRVVLRVALGTVLIVLVVMGGRLWHAGQAGLAAAETELAGAAAAEVWAAAQNDGRLATDLLDTAAGSRLQQQVLREGQALRAIVQQADGSGEATTTAELLRLDGHIAVVRVVVRPAVDGPAYRQTRVYLDTAEGWQRTAPRAAHWGPSQTLESGRFVFHYHWLDAQAVGQAAAILDGLYPSLAGGFSTQTPDGEKVVVQVDPAASGPAVRTTRDAPLVVPSPAVLLAPVTLQEGDVLAQAVVLALLDEQVAQVKRDLAAAAGPHGRIWEDDTRLQDWLDGVRLWQLWAQDLPLAAWRAPVVQWVYAGDGYPTGQAGKAVSRPDPCGLSRLWLSSALQLEALLLCDGQGRVEPSSAWRQLYPPPATLASLGVLPALGAAAGPAARSPHPAAPVALATLLEYAAATYGTAQVPALWAALAEHTQWETLIQAVFGMDAATFEQGWQAYLAAEYGVQHVLPDEAK